MGYKLGSFNMYKFQAYRSDDKIKKDLDNIANIISTEKFDIIAMQEVLDKKPVDMILTRLGTHWKRAWDRPNSGLYKRQRDMRLFGILIELP